MQSGDVIAERFEVERLSAAGGMGRVYRTRDRVSGETVALKVLYRGGVDEAERFAREAQVLATLRHPGIVRYIAYGTTDAGEPYLVLEWLEGETLFDRLKHRGLTLPESLALGGRVAAALGAAHRRGVVHRDVKPSNIFLPGGSVEKVTLIDFGIARLSGVGQLTAPGGLMGTPGYMAPEQTRGEPDLDASADVFSLGCVLYRCLTGRPAFAGEDAVSVLLKVAMADPQPVREVRPEIPAALSDLVSRMLAKPPGARPADGHAVAAALAALESGAPPSVHGFEAPPSSRSFEITTTEKRVMCLVLARPTPVDARGADEGAVRAAVARHQAALESLADGTWFVPLTSSGTATDLATRAARCALGMRALLPGAPISIVAGRGVASARLPVGEMIDRAVHLLVPGPSRRPSPGSNPPQAYAGAEIVVDEVMGGLLALRFELGRRAGADGGTVLSLRGERDELDVRRTLLGKPTACVGREHEVALLSATFARCVEERSARAVLVTAAAGMGKSRLRYELLRRLRDEGHSPEILFGQGDSMSAGSALGMLAHALRRASGIREGEPAEVQRDKLRERVTRHGPRDADRVAALLGELTGVPSLPAEARSAAQLDPLRLGEQMRRAFEELLRAECSAGPVILVLEDLQWGDLSTVRFVDAALKNLRSEPLLVLALARPEVSEIFPNLWSGRDVSGIHLGELGRKAGERLVRQVLGDGVDDATVEAIVDRADGHAFYLEELIRAAAEADPRKRAALPETVLAMVQARLLRLDVEARRALRAASVFGETFWRDGVVALVGGGGNVERWLEDLAEQEVISRSWDERFRDQPEYRFRHALVREAAYGMLTDTDRATGHRLAAEWLERAGERDPLVLAEHYARSGEPARAGPWFARAAHQAMRGGDTAAAIERAELGLTHGAEGGGRASLVTLLGSAHAWANDFGRAAPYLDEAVRISRPGSGRWISAMMSKLLGALVHGRLDTLGEIVQKLETVEPLPEGAAAMVSAYAVVQDILGYVGQHDLADAYSERLEQVAAPLLGDPTTRGWLWYARGNAARQEADLAGSISLLRRAEASFEEGGSPGYLTMVRMKLGLVYDCAGAHDAAEGVLRGVAEIGDHGFHTTLGALHLALTLADRGALEGPGPLEEAEAVLASIHGPMAARKNILDLGILRWISSLIARRRGDLDAARDHAVAAREMTAASPLDHLWATAALADALVAQGHAPDALSLVKRAVADRRAFARPHVLDPYLWLAHVEALTATSDPEAAAALATAQRALRERAEAMADPDLARSFLTRVPVNARLMGMGPG